MSRRLYSDGRRRGGMSGVAFAAVIIVCVLAGMHYAWVLIAIAAIVALIALLWRPIQAYSSRLERSAAPADAALERRVHYLESQVDALSKQQAQLQETLHWQERLLDSTAGDKIPVSRTSASGRT